MLIILLYPYIFVLYNAIHSNVNRKKPINNQHFFSLDPYIECVQPASEILAGLFCICMNH